MLQPYPVSDPHRIDDASLQDIDWVKGFVLAVRRVRGEQNIQPSRRVPIVLQNVSPRDRDLLANCRHYLDGLAGIESVAVLEKDEVAPKSAAGLLGSMKILIPLAGLIDTEAEAARLAREIEKHAKDLERSEQKLANASFVDRAPPEIVDKERTRAKERVGALREYLTKLLRNVHSRTYPPSGHAMRLTTKGRYAVTAMLDLAIHHDEGPVTLAHIAKRQGISLSYLEQLFAQLRKRGLVRSSRGPGGGYRLGRSAIDIAVVDVIGAVDESVDATRCGGMEIHEFLGGIDLAQLVERRRVREVSDRQDQVPVNLNDQIPTRA
jgi:Rrf2 family protein